MAFLTNLKIWIRDEIRHIHDPRMYVRLLEDCFDCGIDLTHSYTALVGDVCSSDSPVGYSLSI